MFTFLLSASYGGNLRAILLSPNVNKPISSTLQAVVDSGLPWSMPLYHDDIDHWLATNTDPTIQKFWKEKEALNSLDEYQYEKVTRTQCTCIYLDKSKEIFL